MPSTPTIYYRNIRDNGILKVPNAANRVLLRPTDGDVVEQLDDNTLWAWHAATATWIPLSSGSFTTGIVVGAPVVGGVANSILFVDGSGDLSQDPLNFVYNSSLGFMGLGVTTPTIPGTVFEVNGPVNLHLTLEPNVIATKLLGTVDVYLGNIPGAFDFVRNSVTGDIAFSGAGDFSALGFSTEAVTNGHIRGTFDTHDTAISVTDNIGGLPTFLIATWFDANTGGGIRSTQDPTQFKIGDNSGTPFFIVTDTGNTKFYYPINDTVDVNSINTDSRLFFDSSGVQSGNYNTRVLSSTGSSSIDWENHTLYDFSNIASITYGNRHLLDTTGVVSANYASRILIDSTALSSINWQTRQLVDAGGINIGLDWMNRQLFNPSGIQMMNWAAGIVYDTVGAPSLDWNNRFTYDSTGNFSINYSARQLYDTLSFESVDWNTRQLLDSAVTPSVDWRARTLLDPAGAITLLWNTSNEVGVQSVNQFYVQGLVNSTFFNVNDVSQLITAGSGFVVFSGVTFTGIGLNDFNLSGTSPVSSVSFTVTITDLNNVFLSYHSLTGTFLIGETVQDLSSGATGVVIADDGAANMQLGSVVGTFSSADNIAGLSSGANATVSVPPTISDIYAWFDGTTLHTNVPCYSVVPLIPYGLVVTFTSGGTGHSVSDHWNFSYAVTISQALSLDMVSRNYALGDLTGVGNGTKILVKDGSLVVDITNNLSVSGTDIFLGPDCDINDDGFSNVALKNTTLGSYVALNADGSVKISDSSGAGLGLTGAGNTVIDQTIVSYNGEATFDNGVPSIVKSLSLGGSSTISPTALGKITGLFRLTCFISTRLNPAPGTTLETSVQFIDGVGARTAVVIPASFMGAGSQGTCSGTYMFLNRSGVISVFTTEVGGGGGKYDMTFILERLK